MPAEARRPRADQPRTVALRLLRAVSEDGAYANLVLPRLITAAGLDARDAALATELGYGTLRAAGVLDLVLAECVDRPLDRLDRPVLDVLRLGAYQLLRTRIPPHAAVATTVELSRTGGAPRAAGLVNAVLRRVGRHDWSGWVARLATGGPALHRLALQTAHPDWIAAAFADALGHDLAETEAALVADDQRPVTHLVAWPGRLDASRLAADSGGVLGPYSPYAVRLPAGDPGDLAAIVDHRAGVQDEGSQLCALALTRAPVTPTGERPERWLDLCAGPGGKTALLAALAERAEPSGAVVEANELHPHRAELVRQATTGWPVTITTGDARARSGSGYDRVLLDAPCTGLGALRRRPEARWRRRPEDLAELVVLQAELLAAARRLVRPGGVVAYVTCSPHPAETVEILAGSGAELIDARPAFAGVDQLGPGPTVQLWPHRHGTDAMFCALIRG